MNIDVQEENKYIDMNFNVVKEIDSLKRILKVYDRIFHQNKDEKWRIQWYYNRFPEKWADQLGGVVRKFN